MITRYVALLDQDKVGLPVNVFVTVKLANHKDETLRGFERAIEACPEVMEMYEMTGASDYLLRVVASDVAAYEAFPARPADAYRGGAVVRVGTGAEAGGLPHEFAAAAGWAVSGSGSGCGVRGGGQNPSLDARWGFRDRTCAAG